MTELRKECLVRPSTFLPALLASAVLCGLAPPAPAEAAPDAGDEAGRADTYYRAGNLVAALPLYEHLAAQAPKDALYAERLAFCLVSRFENLPDGEERRAAIDRARAEAERAQALGDS